LKFGDYCLNLEQIFFQDEDGDIIILNDQIPSGLSVYVFVDLDAIPKNPKTELIVKNNNENLIKFHWIKENTMANPNNSLKVIVDNYLYTTVNDNDVHPPVRSSCTFEKGRHFFVLRKPPLPVYSLLLVFAESGWLTRIIHEFQLFLISMRKAKLCRKPYCQESWLWKAKNIWFRWNKVLRKLNYSVLPCRNWE